MKYYKEKLKILSSQGKEVKVSKKGNPYIVLDKGQLRESEVSLYSVTKNKLNTLGLNLIKRRIGRIVVILTEKAIYIAQDNNLNKLNLPQVKKWMIRFPFLVELHLYGKRCEWIKNDIEYIHYYQFFKSFHSKKEALKFLNWSGKSDLSITQVLCLMIGHEFKHKTELVKTSHNYQYIIDIVNMAKKVNEDSVYNSKKSMYNLHAELVKKVNAAKIEKIDNTKIKSYRSKLLEKFLTKLNIQFKMLRSERDLFEEGLSMHHCISTRSKNLNRKGFANFVWDNEHYSVEFGFDVEIKGKYNKSFPKTDWFKTQIENFEKENPII